MIIGVLREYVREKGSFSYTVDSSLSSQSAIFFVGYHSRSRGLPLYTAAVVIENCSWPCATQPISPSTGVRNVADQPPCLP